MEVINYLIERAKHGCRDERLKCHEITQALLIIKLRDNSERMKNIKGAL